MLCLGFAGLRHLRVFFRIGFFARERGVCCFSTDHRVFNASESLIPLYMNEISNEMHASETCFLIGKVP
jgi:hypothetical protein